MMSKTKAFMYSAGLSQLPFLRNNAGIQRVMDSLGHTDNTSVMKYLSFDGERMRLCPLSLTQYGLLLEGGDE